MCTEDSWSFDEAEIGRRLGHDLFRFSRPLAAAAWPPSLAEGFLQAHAQNVRRETPDRFIRKWLQLRLNAHGRRRHVAQNVTPEFIRSIDVEQCPVLRTRLTHGELLATDWSVDRLHNDGAYAASNLAVMSVAANRAKAALSFEEVHGLSMRLQADEAAGGLQSAHWLRLAALMLGPCFAARPQAAPIIPLVVPIPKFTARQAMQLLQHVFTVMARRPAGKNALIKSFAQASDDPRYKTQLRFLAEAVHAGLKEVEADWDVWLNDAVMRQLLAWRQSLDETGWARAGEIARGLAGGRRVHASRLDAWHLENRGYLR